MPPAEVQHRLKLNDVLFGIIGRLVDANARRHPVDGADRGRSLMGTLHDYGRFLFEVIDGEGRAAYQKAFLDH